MEFGAGLGMMVGRNKSALESNSILVKKEVFEFICIGKQPYLSSV